LASIDALAGIRRPINGPPEKKLHMPSDSGFASFISGSVIVHLWFMPVSIIFLISLHG
jgi:hypothetical protein